MEISTVRNKLLPLCIDSNIEMLGVFGSVARGEADGNSDIDIIARFYNPIGLFELIALEQKMQKLLGRPVDLGTEASLHPLIRESVENDIQIIYGK